MTNRIAIDIGGTFTDFALLDSRTGRTAIHKRLTTPSDPARAVLEGIVELLARQKASMTEVETVMHGTTLITNAVIERRGAVTGFLVTRGFRDVLDIGKEQRYDLFDLRIRSEVQRIHVNRGRVEGVTVNGRFIRGRSVISNWTTIAGSVFATHC